ncbi:allantoicase [Modestobacter sp. I12A-02628]|uniref:Probable allantoicase n=1 Tax=Goekera deserti TaxID=2497753 RepID=A0A7K3WHP6_9ACTN|nr:allantoicase [Goekera deserti]MPQ97738.1 allantoicase [Goekera deserti]NDI48383.1 allantoicase [Goekera deserti]NEL55984.1 allantoicase [Goekera deserti]
MTDAQRLPDLASRALGGAVVAANDELFAARENLVLPHPAVARADFGHKGKEYDGWETRRRRSPGHDWAIVRLGAPGTVAAVVIDTAFFTGNYPPRASVDGVAVEGHPSVEELVAADWQPLLPLVDLAGDTANAFAVASDRRVTHVRLSIHPDGGVARFRVHGTVVPDPRLLDVGPFDLAALENGGQVTAVSNAFYGSPHQLIGRGDARSMGEGWENARRRDDGNDWVEVSLACQGTVAMAELDTSYFLGNAPGAASLTGRTADGTDVQLLPRTRLQPDTRHRFLLDEHPGVVAVRLDVFPDGGMARLRLWGRPTAAGRESLQRRWSGSA